jgi:DNA mismatch repair ATPase MutS
MRRFRVKYNDFKLFLLDEIFKGTNTVERIAAGKAVLSYIGKDKNLVFVSTHDIELTDLLSDSYELYHFTEIVEHEHILFDYKLKKGNLATRNAIRILEFNDYPVELIAEAKEISRKITAANRIDD